MPLFDLTGALERIVPLLTGGCHLSLSRRALDPLKRSNGFSIRNLSEGAICNGSKL